MDNGIRKEEEKMALSFKVVEFANLVGSVNFDNEDCYDNCVGYVTLTDDSRNYLVYESFTNPYERNKALQFSFSEASKVMEKWAMLQAGL